MVTLPATAYIAVGSNEGDRLAQITEARERIATSEWATSILASSSLHASRAVPAGGPEFLNGVIAVSTTNAPSRVLAGLHAIEAAMGRVRLVRWEPRIIDLDLVAWVPHGLSCSVRRSGAPDLPHPRARERDFVLAPLVEVAPHVRIAGRTARAHLDALGVTDRTLAGVACSHW